MTINFSTLSRPRAAFFSVFAVFMVTTLGSLTTTSLVAPLFTICVLATGSFFLAHTTLSAVERLVLVPAVGLSSLAVSSLFIPLISALDVVRTPIHEPVVIATTAALPTVIAIAYWASRPNPELPSVDISSRLLVPALPIFLGGGGALIQRQFGLVAQNYVVMGILVVCGPLLVYWAQTEFETATALSGLGIGVLLSHTLVTGYAVGIDVQMSLHTIDTVTKTGTWSVSNVFFEQGAGNAQISELVGYIGTTQPHVGLPVIVGVPVLFETVGNAPPDAVFDIAYVAVFGLTPAAVYRIGRERLSRHEAFVAGAVVISYYRFFHTSPAKQHLAQFFMAALLVCWIANSKPSQRNSIAAIVSIGIVFSHYAVTFLFLTFITLGYAAKKWYQQTDPLSALSARFISYFYGVTILWYGILTGGKKPLAAVSALAASVQSVLSSGSAQSRTGASVAAQQTVIVDQINLGLHGLLLGAIFLGVLFITYNAITFRRPVFTEDIDPLAVCSFAILGLSMIASGYLGVDRALDITLVILAPVAVLGVREGITVTSDRFSVPLAPSQSHRIGLVFVILFFAFSSGLMYEATGEQATSAINLHENPNSVVYTDGEYEAANWVLEMRNNSTIYTGTYGSTVFHRHSGASLPYLEHYKNFSSHVDIAWDEPGYIFIRKAALVDDAADPVPRHELSRQESRRFRERTELAHENSRVIVLRISGTNTPDNTSQE